MINQNPINLEVEFSKLVLLSDRKPTSTTEEKQHAFANLSDYRDGALYIGYFNGASDWERHSSGDEIVHVFEGRTKLFIKDGESEKKYELVSGEYIVVPKNCWHRFETIGPIKSLTITPAPTDHTIDDPQ